MKTVKILESAQEVLEAFSRIRGDNDENIPYVGASARLCIHADGTLEIRDSEIPMEVADTVSYNDVVDELFNQRQITVVDLVNPER